MGIAAGLPFRVSFDSLPDGSLAEPSAKDCDRAQAKESHGLVLASALVGRRLRGVVDPRGAVRCLRDGGAAEWVAGTDPVTGETVAVRLSLEALE